MKTISDYWNGLYIRNATAQAFTVFEATNGNHREAKKYARMYSRTAKLIWVREKVESLPFAR